MGSTPAFLWGCEAAGPLAAAGRHSASPIHRRDPSAAGAGAGRGLRREGRCFLRRACKERSREASHTTESVRGRVSRVRSRISRAHDLTAWNASALGQRARPTG